jgi:multidrug efflux system outer membrane protein
MVAALQRPAAERPGGPGPAGQHRCAQRPGRIAPGRAQREASAAGLFPNLGASAGGQRNTTGGNLASNSYSTSLDASWEPDVFGATRSGVKAADAEVRAATASLAHVQVSLAAEVAVGFINLRGLQARLAIARSNLATQVETAQIVRWRAQAGLASSLDVEQAVTAAEQTQAQIPALEASVLQSLHALAILSGQAPGALHAALGETAPIPPAPVDLALAFPADTLRQRPDLRAAELRVHAALARVAVADAARYPSLQAQRRHWVFRRHHAGRPDQRCRGGAEHVARPVCRCRCSTVAPASPRCARRRPAWSRRA